MLKARQKELLIQDVFRHNSRPKGEDGGFEWAVLVVDLESDQILERCFDSYDLQGQRIAKKASLCNKEEPENRHAIYFLSPVIEHHSFLKYTSLKTNKGCYFRTTKAMECLPNLLKIFEESFHQLNFRMQIQSIEKKHSGKSGDT